MLHTRSRRISLVAALGAAACFALGAAPAARAQTPDSLRRDLSAPWSSSAQWLSLRGGYAKSGELNAPPAGFGVGVGYTRMLDRWKLWRWTLFKQFSFGGSLHFEHLGTLGRASEYSIPLTLELARHFRWSSAIRPYVGVGGGGYYRKHYRTGADRGTVQPGGFVLFGVNTPLDEQRVLGVDVRYSRVEVGEAAPNPVFPHEESNTSQWSFKVNYSMAY